MPKTEILNKNSEMEQPDRPLHLTFNDHTLAYRVHQLALQGLNTGEIAKKLECSVENVTRAMTQAIRQESIEIEAMREVLHNRTLARTEWLLSKIFPVIEEQSNETYLVTNVETGETKRMKQAPEIKLVNAALKIMQFQVNDLEGKVRGGGDTTNIQINQTISATSDLYNEALAAAQQDYLGYYVAEVPEGNYVLANEDLIKLEEIVQEYLPEGPINDEDLDYYRTDEE